MRVSTDIGGTFTDLVAIGDKGELVLTKSHTTPAHFEQGVVDVIEKSGVDPHCIEELIHGTTTIINALTERKGGKTALITTKGFRDVLEIARCNRPDLFNMVFAKPRPFIPRYLRMNVVADRVSLTGTMRSYRETIHKKVQNRIGPVARGLCDGFRKRHPGMAGV